MKVLNFYDQDNIKLGVQTDQGVLDIAEAAARLGYDAIPLDMHAVIADHAAAVPALRQLADEALASEDRSTFLLDEQALTFAPCVPSPGKIICVGLNYRKHAEETNSPIPDFPVLFNKFNNTIAAPGQDIALPKATSRVDYEAELVIVIGQKTKYVSKEEALSHVFGYCNVNDLSARDLQKRTSQWMLGKICDHFSPLGPYLVTADEVGDPNELEIKCTVNGEVRQHSNTSDMIFKCDEIVSYISQHLTLEPGDIILTGTPEGVVLGYPKEKRVYLQPGDVVTVEIEKLGALTNRMVEEA
ncbi:5-carboxymethyl-2-hydroxymuconate isomerase [Paenibacillus sp. 598K]|uniref:fumarylacetoacetate hydrolase family protein n=1 Tax=Paenibacillus sp. 598K TaxID=1117987 RepID=UPI000FF95E1B|nr:fumarylacetoacetate hydrolase family protein [Paenibacillus sp. 598K]GBF77764.1 5-carboxymethyl-2-hydroxymuconate isomerase [Paenibacillus sp. 598K]